MKWKSVLLGSLMTFALVFTLVVGCVGGYVAAPYIQRTMKSVQVSTSAPVSLERLAPSQGTTPIPRMTPAPSATPIPLPEDFGADERLAAELYRKVSPSVVFVRVVQNISGNTRIPRQNTPGFPQLPDIPNLPQSGSGSGFVIDKDGHIVTNYHVVDSADKVQVTFIDGTTVSAKVVGTDPDSDLAVIQVDVKGSLLQPVELGDSSQLIVGQQTFAIGNPFGQQWTLTSGIVSAVGRTIQSGNSQFSIPEVIQTDAAINPGNSGGPLLDRRGRVIGVNTMILSESGSSSGVGFAVPVNIVKRIVPALIKDGQFTYAYLGLSGGKLTPEYAEAMGLPADLRGVLVSEVVSGGPSEKAGIQASLRDATIEGIQAKVGGDVIVAVDGQAVASMDAIIDYLLTSKRPGDKITLTVLRDGQQKDIQVALGERPKN